MRNVLVIEDDFDLRTILCDFFKHLNYAVESAENGEEALNLLLKKSFTPCVIVMDLFMPIMNGHEFVEKVNKDKIINSPVILISAAPKDSKLVQKTLKYCKAYFMKPTPLATIAQKVGELSCCKSA